MHRTSNHESDITDDVRRAEVAYGNDSYVCPSLATLAPLAQSSPQQSFERIVILITDVFSPPGKLSPTSSHLFKLILPLDRLQLDGKPVGGPPTVFLLHPSQPLSHISRLIVSSLAASGTPSISFTSTTPRGRRLHWSESTDVGDFIRDAARTEEFELHVREDDVEKSVSVEVPSFADRTRFLRRKLGVVEQELQSMEELKRRCDVEAHRGARRMAVGGLAMLVAYWGTVARLTFWDLGWYATASSTHDAQTR